MSTLDKMEPNKQPWFLGLIRITFEVQGTGALLKFLLWQALTKECKEQRL